VNERYRYRFEPRRPESGDLDRSDRDSAGAPRAANRGQDGGDRARRVHTGLEPQTGASATRVAGQQAPVRSRWGAAWRATTAGRRVSDSAAGAATQGQLPIREATAASAFSNRLRCSANPPNCVTRLPRIVRVRPRVSSQAVSGVGPRWRARISGSPVRPRRARVVPKRVSESCRCCCGSSGQSASSGRGARRRGTGRCDMPRFARHWPL